MVLAGFDQLRSNIKTVEASFRKAAAGPECVMIGLCEDESSG
jgi:hypothetical protein